MKKKLKKKFMHTSNAVRYFTGETQTYSEKTMPDWGGTTITCKVCTLS